MNGKKANKYFGLKVKDKITGFSGTVTAFCQYITGCDQYLVLPVIGENGDYPNAHWFDCNRLKVLSDGGRITLDTEVDKGVDQQPPAGHY